MRKVLAICLFFLAFVGCSIPRELHDGVLALSEATPRVIYYAAKGIVTSEELSAESKREELEFLRQFARLVEEIERFVGSSGGR